jgi:hypothetical protein
MSAKSSKASKERKRRDPLKAHLKYSATPRDVAAIANRQEAVRAVLADVDELRADESVSPVTRNLIEPILAMAFSYFRPLARGEEERAKIDDVSVTLLGRFTHRLVGEMMTSPTSPKRVKRSSKKRAKR